MYGASLVVGLIICMIFLGFWAYTMIILRRMWSVNQKLLNRFEMGGNDLKLARQLLRDDLLGLEREMLTFTDSASDKLWGVNPECDEFDMYEILEDKVKDGVQIRFVVSETDFSAERAKSVLRLASHFPERVNIRIVPERPPIDFRLIDNRTLHITHHGSEEDDHRRDYWRSRSTLPENERKDLLAFVDEYEEVMRPLDVKIA